MSCDDQGLILVESIRTTMDGTLPVWEKESRSRRIRFTSLELRRENLEKFVQ